MSGSPAFGGETNSGEPAPMKFGAIKYDDKPLEPLTHKKLKPVKLSGNTLDRHEKAMAAHAARRARAAERALLKQQEEEEEIRREEEAKQAAREKKKVKKVVKKKAPPPPQFAYWDIDWTTRLDEKPHGVAYNFENHRYLPLPPATEVHEGHVEDLSFVECAGLGLTDQVLDLLMNDKAYVNEQNFLGDTALHAACYYGYYDVVEILLSQPHVALNPLNGDWTPMHVAADHGHAAVVERLLACTGVVSDPKGMWGLTPLHLACRNGHAAVVEKLIFDCAGVDVNAFTDEMGDHMTPLHLAAANGHHDCVDLLLSCSKTNVTATTKLGWDALHLAAENGYNSIVELLLWHAKENENGINTNEANCGWTPLHLACLGGHAGVVCILLRAGLANPNVVTDTGFAALHLACLKSSVEIAQLLLSMQDTNPNVLTKGGSTALHIACEGDDPELVAVLLESRVDYTLATGTGDTAGHVAADNKNPAIWEAMERQGIWRSLRTASNNGGVTPAMLLDAKAEYIRPPLKHRDLFVACERGDIAAVTKYFTNSEEDAVNLRNADGRAPLHLAVDKGNVKLVQFLLKQKYVNVNVQDNTGSTPLYLAACLGHHIIVNILLAIPECKVNVLNYGWTPVSLHTAPLDHDVSIAFYQREGLLGAYVHDGRTALHAACAAGHQLIMKMLLLHPRVDVNAKSRGSIRPLQVVAQTGSVVMFDTLLTNGNVNINAQDNHGCTALHDACSAGMVDIVDRLLNQYNIDVNLMTTRYNFGGEPYFKKLGSGTPLHVACEANQPKIAKMLLHHPKINPSLATPWGGTTPLHVAAAMGLKPIVQRLLAMGVNVNALQDDGLSAWDLAYQQEHADVLEMLVPSNVQQCAERNLALRDRQNLTAGSILELQERAICSVNENLSLDNGTYYPTVLRYKGRTCERPEEVYAVGDFNGWNKYLPLELTKTLDMEWGQCWLAVAMLPAGRSRVQFLVDGYKTVDPGTEVFSVENGEAVNIITAVAPAVTEVVKPDHDKLNKPFFEEAPHDPEIWRPTFIREEKKKVVAPVKKITKGLAILGIEVHWEETVIAVGWNTLEKTRCIITNVKPDGASALAGIHPEDEIEELNGRMPYSRREMLDILKAKEVGDIIDCVVTRAKGKKKQKLTFEIRITEIKTPKPKPKKIEETMKLNLDERVIIQADDDPIPEHYQRHWGELIKTSDCHKPIYRQLLQQTVPATWDQLHTAADYGEVHCYRDYSDWMQQPYNITDECLPDMYTLESLTLGTVKGIPVKQAVERKVIEIDHTKGHHQPILQSTNSGFPETRHLTTTHIEGAMPVITFH